MLIFLGYQSRKYIVSPFCWWYVYYEACFLAPRQYVILVNGAIKILIIHIIFNYYSVHLIVTRRKIKKIREIHPSNFQKKKKPSSDRKRKMPERKPAGNVTTFMDCRGVFFRLSENVFTSVGRESTGSVKDRWPPASPGRTYRRCHATFHAVRLLDLPTWADISGIIKFLE